MSSFRLSTPSLLLLLLHFISQTLALPQGFFYSIDGISVGHQRKYMCAIEQTIGHEIGGKVHCWGQHKHFRFKPPFNDPPPDDIFVQIAIADSGGCGITLEQRVKCWGYEVDNFTGDIGPEGLFTQISAGDKCICGVRTNGAINCFFGYAKLFDISKTGRSDFVQVSCGSYYCCGLDTEGGVDCRGDVKKNSMYDRGKLHRNPSMIMKVEADGELTYAPGVQEPSNTDSEEYEDFLMNYRRHLKQFKQIAVAHGFMCGIEFHSDNIFCWGNDDVPLPVEEMKGPFKMVSAHGHQVCGILSESNQLRCAKESSLALMEDQEWDQIKVGYLGSVCGVTMGSELICSNKFAEEIVEFYIA